MADDLDPQGRGEIAGLLERHGVRPRQALGQHFLADPNLVRRIVAEAAVGAGDRVLEVGAGTGTLTRALAATGAAVLAYEVDERLAPLLRDALASAGHVTLRFADAMRDDLGARLGAGPWVMVANLPYNVGTPLVLDLLRSVPAVARYVVMVQREVADRFVASPGDKRYGLPSVVVGLYAAGARVAFGVPPDVFVPRPAVASAVVTMARRPDPPAAAGAAVDLAAAAFGQRRKQLRNSLRAALDDPEAVLAQAGIDPHRRAEELAPADYLALAGAVDAG